MNYGVQGGNRSLSSFRINKHLPGANNTAAIITLAAVADRRNVVGRIYWSYSILTPAAAGAIRVENGSGNIVAEFDIVVGGPGVMDIFIPGSINTAMIITLTAISDATGKLNVESLLD